MRVLMVSKACLVGAYQRKLEEIAAHADVELAVIVPPSWHEAGRRVELEPVYTAGYRLIVEPMRFNGHFHLHFYPGLRHHLEAFQPDVLHIDEEPYNLATFHALRLARRMGIRTLFFTWQNLHRRYPPPFSWMERHVLRHADAAIAGNREAAKVLRAKGYTGPIAVIPQFGVDPEMFRPHERRAAMTDPRTERNTGGENEFFEEGSAFFSVRRDSPRPFTIGYVGRLVPEKGVHLLLEAVAGLEGNWQVRLLGEGPRLKALRTQVRRLGIEDRVRFDSPLPSCHMPDYLNGLDVLVLPSCTRPNWKEQFGRVLIEAMACGVPVVGSTCGEIPNVIGDAGLIFPEEDVPALREHLQRLQCDLQLRHRLAEAGRQRVLERFTQARIATDTVAVYRQLASSGQRLADG